MWTYYLFIIALCGTVLVKGDCNVDNVPKDHPALQAGIECTKIHGKDRLCAADCAGLRLEFINEEGDYQPEKVQSMIALVPEGDLKDAIKEIWAKCAKSGKGKPINRTLPNCSGFVKFGRCVMKILDERCPNVAQMLQM